MSEFNNCDSPTSVLEKTVTAESVDPPTPTATTLRRPLTEEEARALPCFAEWCQRQVKLKPPAEYFAAITNGKWTADFGNAAAMEWYCCEIVQKYGGLLKQDDPKFEESQFEFRGYYKKLMQLWMGILAYFDIRMPNWDYEILPERYSFGVLLSQEHYEKYILGGPGSGLVKLKPESQAQFEMEMEKKQLELQEKFKRLQAKDEEDDESVMVA